MPLVTYSRDNARRDRTEEAEYHFSNNYLNKQRRAKNIMCLTEMPWQYTAWLCYSIMTLPGSGPDGPLGDWGSGWAPTVWTDWSNVNVRDQALTDGRSTEYLSEYTRVHPTIIGRLFLNNDSTSIIIKADSLTCVNFPCVGIYLDKVGQKSEFVDETFIKQDSVLSSSDCTT